MSAIQSVVLGLLVISTLLCIICVGLPFWKINDPEDTIRDNIVRHEGLWLRCNSFSTGNWDCDDFNRFFLGLPKELQAGRGFSLTSIVLSVFSIITLCVGMDSIPCGTDDKSVKRRIRMVSAILACISALLIIAAVSWYANDVRIEHEQITARKIVDPGFSQNRFIFGVALFIGWIGGTLMLISGLIAFCTTCGGRTYEDAQPRYAYRPPAKAVGGATEYI